MWILCWKERWCCNVAMLRQQNYCDLLLLWLKNCYVICKSVWLLLTSSSIFIFMGHLKHVPFTLCLLLQMWGSFKGLNEGFISSWVLSMSMSLFISLYFYSKHWIWSMTIIPCWLCPLNSVFFDLWRIKNNQENYLLGCY